MKNTTNNLDTDIRNREWTRNKDADITIGKFAGILEDLNAEFEEEIDII